MGHKCKFIMGDPKDRPLVRCDKPVRRPWSPYCAFHHRVTHLQRGSPVEEPEKTVVFTTAILDDAWTS